MLCTLTRLKQSFAQRRDSVQDFSILGKSNFGIFLTAKKRKGRKGQFHTVYSVSEKNRVI